MASCVTYQPQLGQPRARDHRARAVPGARSINMDGVVPMAKPDNNRKQPFLTDVQTLRKRAREHIEQGAVTQGYTADRETVLKLLNEALATELICVLRYRRHYFMASGLEAQSVAAEFLQHANEEQGH